MEDKVIHKVVLIPVDFSDYSIRTCEIGFKYASEIGAEVRLLHAYCSTNLPSTLTYFMIGQDNFAADEDSIKKAVKEAKAEMDKLESVIEAKIADGQLPAVKYDHVITEGLPEDEIIAYSKKFRPMLILMGTRGENRKNLDLIGSVTAEIIEITKIPLLTIPENVSFDDLKNAHNIAFAISFSQQDLVAFDHFVELVGCYNPKIHLFNIVSSKSDWDEVRLAGTREYFRKHYPTLDVEFSVFDNTNILVSVENFVRNKQIDVIALTTYRHSIITRIFNPSIARKMLFHTNTALLVIPLHS
ncbi:MAG: universal stress protein [Tannerella sp.]|jgi:nucleotide-binding universal stress UspA family protein|nr:universal stress protein [Tannerella sp.]